MKFRAKARRKAEKEGYVQQIFQGSKTKWLQNILKTLLQFHASLDMHQHTLLLMPFSHTARTDNFGKL